MTTALVTHANCALHEMGPLHPETPLRLQFITDALKAAGLYDLLEIYQAPKATDQQLERAHDPRHLEALRQIVPREGHVRLDLETTVNPSTLESATRAAGANVRAVDLVLNGSVDNAFCCVRPPGHHAERDRPVGFCFLNNVAVGAAEALEHRDIDRVLIIDFDVHHGNGTEDIFEDDPRVMICSTFQSLLLPRKLFEEHGDRIINVPLDAGTGSDAFRRAVTDRWLPAIEQFDPDLVMVSAGFDAHWLDTVSGLNFTEADYAWVTGIIKQIAARHCQGRLVSSLEGGYHFTGLGASVAAHVRELMA